MLQFHREQVHLKKTPTKAANKRGRSLVYRCRFNNECQESFSTRRELIRHRLEVHLNSQLDRTFDAPLPWMNDDNTINAPLREIMLQNRHFIFRPHVLDDVHNSFHVPLVNSNSWQETLLSELDNIRVAVPGAIKVNISLGYILINNQGEYRYFVAGGNFPLFTHPIVISRPGDWNNLRQQVNGEYISDQIEQSRPDTTWSLAFITDAVVDVYPLGFNMGCSHVDDFIKASQCIISLTHDRSGNAYDDRNCAVRALAFHRLSNNDIQSNAPPSDIGTDELKHLTNEYAKLWGREGLSMNDVPEFENIFDIDCYIYRLEKDGSVIPIYISEGTRDKNCLPLNLNRNHLSYITNLPGYLVKYKCSGCGRHFKRLNKFEKTSGIM